MGVKILDISSDQQPGGNDVRPLVGLRLPVSVNPTGLHRWPTAVPDSTVLLHPGDEAIFDFVRLCVLPGNFLFCHSSYVLNPRVHRVETAHDGTVSPGKYVITLSAQGDNLAPVLDRFEVASTASEMLFQRIAVAGL